MGIDGGNVRLREVGVDAERLSWYAMGRCCGREYLVECDGRLLMVCEVLSTLGVDGFSVDEINVGTGVAVGFEDLGGRALFIGRNETICVEDVERYGCEPNCVFHAGDSDRGWKADRDSCVSVEERWE